jgi:hypothetical protein
LALRSSANTHFSLLYQRGRLASPAEMLGLPPLKVTLIGCPRPPETLPRTGDQVKETNAFPAVFANSQFARKLQCFICGLETSIPEVGQAAYALLFHTHTHTHTQI